MNLRESQLRISVQLYTLRDLTSKDFFGTLQKLSDVGFKSAQPAGLFGNDPKEVKERCDDMGLQLVAPHVGLGDVEEGFEKTIQMCHDLGTNLVVVPYVGKEVYDEGWEKAGNRFEEIGKRCRKEGVAFLYHNHAFEFELENGKPGFDRLWETADARWVQAEIDAYWVLYGGGDTVAYLNRLSGRVRTMHFKDMSKEESRENCDVGDGRLNWPEIIEAAKEAGVHYAIIERDTCTGDPLEHVSRSRNYLLKQGLTD